ncbi:WecB/TagA/CpsF family glycosyltransferase [Paracidobacterium acidisoli]|nr:WecB/TagA/CpsF family glycosyltransferase [Paracidobacterium acidisoli]MBT9330258.1 WecB/TagA/CpsF family glycosyltransferase [Paracidobacterium acidisoli]
MQNTTFNTVAVLGVPFHNVTMDDAVSFIDRKIEEGGFHQVATANVDFLMHAIRDRELQEILCSCSLVVPDGMPILWASKLLGSRLRQRVCGVDLVPRLAELAVRRNYRIFLLGASESVSQRASEKLKQKYPGLQICGRYSPPVRPLQQMNHDEILQKIETANPDILLVAFGNPKQEKWLSMHRDRLKVPVCIGVGGSLDFIAGSVARAPKWMQRGGLEWLYRMLQEPKRLAQRYIGDALGLAAHMPQQLVTHAMQPRQVTRSGIFADRTENTMVVSIYGDFAGGTLTEFSTIARDAVFSGMNLVLNLSQTTYLSADALGELIHLRSTLLPGQQQLWLAEMRPHLLRLLQAARLNTYFMTTSSVRDALYRTARAEQRMLAHAAALPGHECVAQSGVQVRVELLQGICQRVAAASHPSHDGFTGPTGTVGGYTFNTSVG